jgi:hypothetical protein
MERSGPLPAMEGASDARDGEDRAHAMERSGVGLKVEKCVVHFYRWAMREQAGQLRRPREVRPD